MTIREEDVKVIAEGLSDFSHKLSGKTVLLTGGAGFLGNYFLSTIQYLNAHVLEKPCRVISIDNFITGIKYHIKEGDNFKAIKHDVMEPLDIDEDVHFIIHAAGLASPKFYRQFRIETIDVGTIGTKNMLELCRKKNAESMLYFSSSEVYGDPDPKFVPTPETYNGNVSCTGPRANYDESKRLGETLCVNYFDIYKVPVKMVRPFNVYGPGMRLDDYRVLPNYVSHIFQGKPIPVYGTGANTRTFCYISDAMIGFMRLLLCDENGESFNVGNDQDEISVEELAHIVDENFDNKAAIAHVAGPTDAYADADPKRRCPDLTKIEKAVGYRPMIDLRSGVSRFIQSTIEDNDIKSDMADLFMAKVKTQKDTATA